MAFSFIAAASNLNDAAGTTLDTSGSLNVAAGDLLVCFCCNEESLPTYAVAKNSGSPANTFTFDAGDAISNAVFGQMGYLLSAAADATATFRMTTSSVAFRRFFVLQFRNAGATIVKDTSSDGTGNSATANSGNITTTGADGIVCGGSDLFNGGATSAEKINGVAADGVTRQSAASMWYRVMTATFAGGAAVSTEGVSDLWICGVMAFKSVVSGPSPGYGTTWFPGAGAAGGPSILALPTGLGPPNNA